MPRLSIMALALGLALFTPLAANAVVVDGSFSGVLTSGTDTSGVFETAGSDLTGQSLTGTFTYDTSLLSGPVAETYSGTGLGAITATITINSVTYTFTDQTSSSLYLDTGASEITVQNAQSQGGVNESFYLDASDFLTPFITSGDPTQQNFVAPVSDPFFSSDGTFLISDPGANAYGYFTLTALSASVEVPEPGSLLLVAIGAGATITAKKRRAMQ